MKQIRKFTFAGLFSALLGLFFLIGGTGCTRDDVSEMQIGKGASQPITFQVANPSALTKGGESSAIVEHLGSTLFDVVDGDSLYLSLESSKWEENAITSTKVTPYSDRSDLTGSSFGFAAYKQDADDSAVNTWTLHGGPVEAPYNGTYWEPTTTILWPNLGKKVHFFAYAPYDAALTMTAANGTEPTLSGFQVGERFFRIVKDLIGGSRNAVFLHQILGEGLAALDDRRIGRRSKDTEPLGFKRVDNSRAERIVHTADSQIDLVVSSKSGQCVKIHSTDRNALRNLCNACVSGGTIKRFHLRASSKRLRDRMLSAASAYQ